MNVVCVAHYYPPHVGGLEIVAQKQARTLVARGHEVSVVTCATHKEQKSSIDSEGVRVHFIRALNFFDTHFGIPFPLPSIELWHTLSRTIARADIVHIHDVFYIPSWCAYFLARSYGKPIVLTQHVGLVEHSSTVIMWIQRIVYTIFGKPLFKKSAEIIVYNRNVKQFLLDYGVDAQKILEIRNGIDLKLFYPASADEKKELRKSFGLPVDRPLALFVGRFVPKKGADAFFAARDSAYDLVFAGSGTVPPEWNTQGVHVLGPLNQDTLARLYRLADVFVLPARGEIFPLAIQEAMASGLPIITTNEPSYQQYDLDYECISLVKPAADDIRGALKKIVSNPDVRERMNAYSLKIAHEWFDWEKNVDQLIAVYERINKKQQVFVTTSWDDGHQLDLKLANLLRAYHVPGTFYISPNDREIAPNMRLTDAQIRELSEHFEIGAHTMTHPRLTRVDEATSQYEIEESKKYLEAILKKPVTSFCYPQGYFNDTHVRQAKNAGYTYGRTVARFSNTLGTNVLTTDTTVHAYRHWSDALPILRAVGLWKFFRCYLNWDELAIQLFERTLRTGGIFHLWGHSWEIDNNGDWKRLERVLKHIELRKRARYVTNSELV